MGAENKNRGIRITKTRTTETTKVKATAKQADAKTIGAMPTRNKAQEVKTANARFLETTLRSVTDML